MPIRTLADLERDEQARPMPNPWAQGNVGGNVGGQEEEGMYGQQQGFQYNDPFWSYNLPPGEQPKLHHMCCMCCCPCCVGPPCSPARRNDWSRAFRTFILWISIIDIIYFIVELSFGVAPLSENSTIGPTPETLIRLGAKETSLIAVNNQVWRLFVPIIMHGGIVHIFFNLLVQFLMGLALEEMWGHTRIMVIYFFSGVGGVLMSCMISPSSLSVGASGAILGIVGARLGQLICSWSSQHPQMRCMNLFQILLFIGLTMIFSVNKYIDFGGHLGGVIIGFLLGTTFFSYAVQGATMRKVAFLGSLILTVTYFIVTITLLFTVFKTRCATGC